MQKRCLTVLTLLVGLLGLLFLPAQGSGTKDDLTIRTEYALGFEASQFDKRKYTELKDSALTERVNQIVERIVRVADRRAGINIQVTVLNTGLVDARAYPGGFIVLTKGLIEKAPTDDQLAMVIAHEIAHEMRGHLDTPPEELLQRVSSEDLIRWGIRVQGKGFKEELADAVTKEYEVQADRFGILWASVAGYDISQAESIFNTILTAGKEEEHLSKEERVKLVRERIQDVIDKLEIFEAGVRFHLRGEYHRAIEAFESFLSSYPSREVYINLGASYYAAALGLISEEDFIPKCSIQIETEIKGLSFRTRGTRKDVEERLAKQLREYLDKAEEFYKKAIEAFPDNPAVHNNLGCVYLAVKNHLRARIHFLEALDKNSKYKEAHNNLGALALEQGEVEEAIKHLNEALKIEERYADPYYNLGVAYRKKGQPDKSRNAFAKYLDMTTNKKGRYVTAALRELGRSSEERRDAHSLPPEIMAGLPFHIGVSLESVKDQLGEPDKVIEITSDTALLLYPKRALKIMARNDQVSEIVFTHNSDKKGQQAPSLLGKPDWMYTSGDGFSAHQIYSSYNPGAHYIVRGSGSNRRVVSWSIFEN